MRRAHPAFALSLFVSAGVAVGVAACVGTRDAGTAASGPPQAAATTPAGLAAYGPAARAACDSTAASWRAIPGITVAEHDTTFDTMADTLHPLGCHVMAVAKTGVDSAHATLDYWSGAEQRRWLPLWRYSADGPDGGVLTWEREGVRCEVRESQDGGDDSDSTYVPSPETSQVTFCWRYTGPPARRDTLGLNPLPPPSPGAITGTRIRIRPDTGKRKP